MQPTAPLSERERTRFCRITQWLDSWLSSGPPLIPSSPRTLLPSLFYSLYLSLCGIKKKMDRIFSENGCGHFWLYDGREGLRGGIHRVWISIWRFNQKQREHPLAMKDAFLLHLNNNMSGGCNFFLSFSHTLSVSLQAPYPLLLVFHIEKTFQLILTPIQRNSPVRNSGQFKEWESLSAHASSKLYTHVTVWVLQEKCRETWQKITSRNVGIIAALK